MKFPIKWHLECLANFEASITKQRETVNRQKDSLAESERQLEFAKHQIATAQAKGLDAFDPGKFLVKKK